MGEAIDTGIVAAAAELAAAAKASGDTNESEINPVKRLMTLRDESANIRRLLDAMNETFAVVKYGSKTVVASIVGKGLDFMKVDDFNNMLANLVVQKEIEIKDDSGTPQKTTRAIIVSKHWFKSKDRRQYFGRGVVFEPGEPLEVRNDMLNLWRGFGVEPKQGDWSLMRKHIHDVICSGNEEHFQYLIRWMAYGVQYPDRPIGVAIALRGEEGAGNGFLWRNYGKLFGIHFKHVAHGEHLTGRFNAVLAETCAVFLDEALWAGDRKGEQILKALITEETFQLERKNYDPIPVKNRLRVMIASNNQWIVPIGTRGRRYAVFDVSDKYADEKSPEHMAYWEPLQAQFGDDAPDDGRAAMLYDLQHMDLSGFNVRAVPDSAAKTEQKLLSLRGAKSWLHQALQDGAIGYDRWQEIGLTVSKDHAYENYNEFSKQRREWQPEAKNLWSKSIRDALSSCMNETRPGIAGNRVRQFVFAPLTDCRRQFANHVGDPNLEWESPDNELPSAPGVAVGQTTEDVGEPTDPDALHDAHVLEMEEPDNAPKKQPKNEPEGALREAIDHAAADLALVRSRTRKLFEAK